MKRLDDTWERSIRKGLWRRLTLRRADGRVYLDRWGIVVEHVGGFYFHRMTAPDPGVDLHDHPWSFVSIVLWGGYTEERAPAREASFMASVAEQFRCPECRRGVEVERRWLTGKMLRLDECHRITTLHRRTVWTLVLRGPRRRSWGFYLPNPGVGYVPEPIYDQTVRAERRDLWSDGNLEARPW